MKRPRRSSLDFTPKVKPTGRFNRSLDFRDVDLTPAKQPSGVVAGINFRIDQLETKLTEARSDITYACGVINTMAAKLANLQARVDLLNVPVEDNPIPKSAEYDAWANRGRPPIGKAAFLFKDQSEPKPTSLSHFHVTDEAAREIERVLKLLTDADRTLRILRTAGRD